MRRNATNVETRNRRCFSWKALRRRSWSPAATELLFATLVSLLLPGLARAQFTGFSAPLTITNTPFNAQACTGSPQTAVIANEAQSEHFITVTTSGVVAFRATVQGSHDGVTFNDISDVVTISGSTAMGQGYYPVVQVSVTCSAASGTFTLKYSGQATAPAMQIAALQSAQIDKTIAVAAPAGSNFTSQNIRTPFGSSAGGLYFSYAATGPSGSTINLQCGTLAIGTVTTIVSFPPASTSGPQFFPVAPLPCDFMTVLYNFGGASATTWTASYVFNGIPINGADPCQGSTVPKKSIAINISTATTTQLIAGLPAHAIYVCGYQFTVTGSATAGAAIQYGTNTNCAAGTVSLTGSFAGATTPVPVYANAGYSVVTVPPGDYLCILTGGATPNVQGVLTYIQQ